MDCICPICRRHRLHAGACYRKQRMKKYKLSINRYNIVLFAEQSPDLRQAITQGLQLHNNMIEQWVMYHEDFHQVPWNVFIKYSFVSDEDLCCQNVIPLQFSRVCVCSLSLKHPGISWSRKLPVCWKKYLAVTLSVPEQCGDFTITSLPTKTLDRPLLLSGFVSWKTVALRATVGVGDTAILLAVAEWIVAAADHSLLRQDCGSLVLTKHAWAKANSVEKNGICEAPSLKAKGAVSFGHSCWRHNKWHHSVSRNQLGSDRHSP